MKQGNGSSRRRVLFVALPGQADPDGLGVGEGTDDDAGTWVLVDGALGGATGGDHGEPVDDVLGLFDDRSGPRWQPADPDGSDSAVEDETAFADLGESE
ncbi:hypothetical protein SAMN05192558_103523 [Actinokineospora alba]|uniref:Uncharacterized protein n=1 Tax=Actinokineospora alba TaxID=504798 RepID=A0A1H0KKW6_9PSEU|nr:hypothetical protein [Actinokineospora alba]TDP67865.1 hypothetical protein C8E96_3419 [Actinokineospora alba]SDH87833.1 hypothetical protein SAMN05421871_102526 [Actinokineospora alba]SDO56463.1 hypothetical protein SAMN05192558_103523 [Actinokineospora alba]